MSFADTYLQPDDGPGADARSQRGPRRRQVRTERAAPRRVNPRQAACDELRTAAICLLKVTPS